jgi:stage II sporulation protein D
MRTLRWTLIFTLLAISAPSGATTAVSSTFVIAGEGLGHGVGMSQVGAFVQAQQGRTAAEIIAHYYPKAELATVNDDLSILVNVAANQTSLQLSAVPIRKNQLVSLHLTNGVEQLQLTAGSAVSVTAAAGQLQLSYQDTAQLITTAKQLEFGWSGITGYPATEPKSEVKLTRSDGTASQYRFGPLQVSAVGNRVQAVLKLRVKDEYLNAVAEMASTWPAAALQAQAIAARSMALTAVNSSVKANCSCHVNSFIDQNMRGSERYKLPGYPNWRKAVKQTAGQVITINQQPVAAWFFARSTGKTENSEDVWGSPRPWAISVEDQYSIDPLAGPQVRWQVSVSAEQLAKIFKLPDVVKVSVVARNPGGSVKTFRAVAASGQVANLPGRTLRAAIPTRSVWIQSIKPQGN